MTEKEILKEITSIDTSFFADGLSFGEHFEQTQSQYPAEILLFSTPDEFVKKYYYNYSEKMLRYIVRDAKSIQKVKEVGEDDHLFDAVNDEDQSSISFSSLDVVNKVIVYDDFRKLITHDPKTGHYECFFIDVAEEEAKAIVDDFTSVFNIDRPMIDNTIVDAEPDSLDNDEDRDKFEEITEDEFSAAASTIAKWMLSDGATKKVTFFINDEGIVELDIHSKMFFNGEGGEERL